MRDFNDYTLKLTLYRKIILKILINYIYYIVNYLYLILLKSITFKLGNNLEIFSIQFNSLVIGFPLINKVSNRYKFFNGNKSSSVSILLFIIDNDFRLGNIFGILLISQI